jgi:hypothetical protein
MRQQNRHVLLLCDNASSHKKFNQVQLSNVRVEFLAPNLTAFVQPLDSGIIRCFKAHYRQRFLRKVIERDTADLSNIYHIDQLEAMKLTARAWDAVAPSTIANCWRHTGICPPNFFPIAESLALEDSVMVDLQADLDTLAQAIGAQSFSAQDLVDVDRNIDTEEELTDQMIIDQVKSLLKLN